MKNRLYHIILILLSITVIVFSGGVGIIKHYCNLCDNVINVLYSEDSKEFHKLHHKYHHLVEHDACCGDTQCQNDSDLNSSDCCPDEDCDSELFQIAVVNLKYSKVYSAKIIVNDIIYFNTTDLSKLNNNNTLLNRNNSPPGDKIQRSTGRTILTNICTLII